MTWHWFWSLMKFQMISDPLQAYPRIFVAWSNALIPLNSKYPILVFLFGKWETHLSLHHKFSYFVNVNILTFQTFHLLITNSFEQYLMHLLCKLHFMPFHPCPKEPLYYLLGKLCQATQWFYIHPISHISNNMVMSNATFQFHTINPFMADLI